MIAFVQKCKAVSLILFLNYLTELEILFFVFKAVMTYAAYLKKNLDYTKIINK